MINCRKATELISESRERSLNKSERWALMWHKAMCTGCRNFAKNIDTLSELSRSFKYISSADDDKPKQHTGGQPTSE